MLNLNHKKLEVWKQGMILVKEINDLTLSFPKSELFCLSSQLRRAALSVVSNIAEGAARKSDLERKRFFEIARSSIVEIDTQLEVCIVLKYVEVSTLKNIEDRMNQIFAMLSGLIKS